jgi:hypothetical protein
MARSGVIVAATFGIRRIEDPRTNFENRQEGESHSQSDLEFAGCLPGIVRYQDFPTRKCYSE